MKIIGLMGRAGSGKDTVRAMLEQQYGFTGLAFADPIRTMLSGLLSQVGESDNWMTDRVLKEATIPSLGTSYRHLAQTLGTEWGRSIDTEIWLRIGKARADRMRQNGVKRLVISDVRFINEAEWIRRAGGHIWRIDRPQVGRVRLHTSELVSHINPDRVIPNTGTVADLTGWIDALMWERA